MLKPPLLRLQPSYYGAFRCVGADCEDNCCSGWRVPVDKKTFERYQSCSHAELGVKLQSFVTLNPHAESDAGYAEIRLDKGACPFLSNGLCQIHAALGPQMLSANCAIFPRALVEVEGFFERSLSLSCPEAARLALTNPEPMEFVPFSADESEAACNLAYQLGFSDIREVRSHAIGILQNRAIPLLLRLREVGNIFLNADIPPLDPVLRFETIVELILARISNDATNRRFLDCYQEFMRGMQWTGDSPIDQLGRNLESASQGLYANFLHKHGYMMEHYLVNYVFRNAFPLGVNSVNQKLAEHGFAVSSAAQYEFLVVLFVMVESLLAGAAAFHGADFGVAQALKVFQAFSKTFEHSVTFPGKALQLLAQKGISPVALLR